MDEEIFQDNRFSQLLAPVRDLAKNWDIDLAALLKSYQQDLETFTCDIMPSAQQHNSQRPGPSQQSNGTASLNFAQAAFLIQGSAQIYSKKVEYLYEMTLDLWEYMSKKNADEAKKRANADPDDQQENAAETPTGRILTRQTKKNRCMQDDDNDEPLAPLDDIEIGANVDLNDESDEPKSKKKRRRTKNVKLLKPMPLDLVPLEDYEKSDAPLIAKSGELVGKKDDYRVNTCFLHESGALLLDVDNAKLIDAHDEGGALDQCPSPCESSSPYLQGREMVGGNFASDVYTSAPPFSATTNDISGLPSAQSPLSASTYPGQISPTLPAGGQANSLMDVGGVDADHDEGSEPFEPDGTSKGSQSLIGRNCCRAGEKTKDVLSVENLEVEKNRLEQLAKNALELLDEFGLCQQKIFQGKPAKKVRKTYRMPDCLQNAKIDEENGFQPKKGKKIAGEETVQKAQPATETLSQFFNAVLLGRRLKMSKNPLKVVAYAELDDLFYDQQKRRRKAALTAGRLRSGKVRGLGPKEVSDAVKKWTTLKEGQPADDDDENIDASLLERNLLAIFEGPDLDDSLPNAENCGVNDVNEAPHEREDAAVDLADDDFIGGAASSALCTPSSGTQFGSYEDAVKYNVEQHLLRAQQNVHLTDVDQRVREWEEKITPLLATEEKHRIFDINLYGDEILQVLKFTNPDTPVLFANLAAGKEKYEICRYTLACLMLANHGKVEIISAENLEHSINTMKLRLVTSHGHRRIADE